MRAAIFVRAVGVLNIAALVYTTAISLLALTATVPTDGRSLAFHLIVILLAARVFEEAGVRLACGRRMSATFSGIYLLVLSALAVLLVVSDSKPQLGRLVALAVVSLLTSFANSLISAHASRDTAAARPAAA